MADLMLVDRSHTGRSPADQLVRYAMESWEETVADPRFTKLQETRRECVQARGYSTLDDELGSVVTEESWTSERKLEAFLAQATCSDQQNFTQQAADIGAEYELTIIQDHEADVVAVKKVADEVVTAATQVLRDAGVI